MKRKYSFQKIPSVPQSIDIAILQEATDILSNRFQTQIEIKTVVRLSETSRRNLVLRLTIQNPSNNAPKSIILKKSILKTSTDHKEAFGRFARDWAGLEFLSCLNTPAPLAPKFYGASQRHCFVLLEDLGEIHTSLVDPLMGDDRDKADAALKRYMKVMGAFHGYSHKSTQQYSAILNNLNPNALLWQDDFDDMLSKIEIVLKKLDIPISSDLKNEISLVFKLAKDPGSFITLMHGDFGTNNVFDNPKNNETRIIDFEWSFVGNALLDAVALRMSMPTCWCVKAFPEDVIETFELIYRKELIQHIPAASDDILYYESYTAACAYWMLWRVVSLEDILETEVEVNDPKFPAHPKWKPEYNLRRPRNLYRFQTFITIAEKNRVLPNLCEMTRSILKKLNHLWPDVKSLELYPVFLYNQTKQSKFPEYL